MLDLKQLFTYILELLLKILVRPKFFIGVSPSEIEPRRRQALPCGSAGALPNLSIFDIQ